MNRDLKITAIIGAALALSLAVTGLWLLTCARHIEANQVVRAHQAEANRQAFEELRNERWKALMHDVQGQVRQKSMAKRENALRQTLAEEPYAQGAFIWVKGKGPPGSQARNQSWNPAPTHWLLFVAVGPGVVLPSPAQPTL